MVIKTVKVIMTAIVPLPTIPYLLLRLKNIQTGRIQISKLPTKEPVILTIGSI